MRLSKRGVVLASKSGASSSKTKRRAKGSSGLPVTTQDVGEPGKEDDGGVDIRDPRFGIAIIGIIMLTISLRSR